MRKFTTFAVALALALGLVACSDSSGAAPPPPQPSGNPQGFELDAAGWTTTQGITRVASGAGTLHLTASSGGYYAEVASQADAYAAGYGDAGYSFFGGKGTAYKGPFYQAIDVYVDPTWGPAGEGFWIDMTPNHTDPANYGAEHNFHITATGSEIDVSVDQGGAIAAITRAGWYTFLMTFEKGATDADPVVTHMAVIDSENVPVGAATVYATSPGGPFTGADLLGNGYVWITVWKDGFANDVVGIDNLRTGLLPYR